MVVVFFLCIVSFLCSGFVIGGWKDDIGLEW